MLEIDDGAQGWLLKTSLRNYWRVSSLCDLDDLIQDGYVYYYKVANRYPKANRRHLMSLFKTAFTNHIHNMSKSQSRIPVLVDEEYGLYVECEDSKLDMLIAQAPPPVKLTLRALQTDMAAKECRRVYRVRRRHRETTNERWCRIVGLNPKQVNLPRLVREYLQNEKMSMSMEKEVPCEDL